MPAFFPSLDLSQEAIEKARRQTVSEKLALGGDLFDGMCKVALTTIRDEFPAITPEQALAELERRLELAKTLERRL